MTHSIWGVLAAPLEYFSIHNIYFILRELDAVNAVYFIKVHGSQQSMWKTRAPQINMAVK